MRGIEIVMATSAVTLGAVASWAAYALSRFRAPWSMTTEERAALPVADARRSNAPGSSEQKDSEEAPAHASEDGTPDDEASEGAAAEAPDTDDAVDGDEAEDPDPASAPAAAEDDEGVPSAESSESRS